MGVYQKDEELLKKIKLGDQRIVKDLFYEYKSSFIGFFASKYVDESTALEIYTRSFTIFYFNVIEGKLNPPLESSIKTYLHSIGINVMRQNWSASQRKQEEPIEQVIHMTSDFREPGLYDYFYHDANKKLVQKILQRIDEKCRSILEMSFIKGFSDNAIMYELEFSNENAVRQQRFRCLQKAKKLLS